MKRAPGLHSCRRSGGFTLVELLVVLAIIGIVAGLVVVSLSGVTRAYYLSSASQSVLGQLNFARQSALSSNKAVDVRIYKIVDPGYNSATAVYRAVQVFREDTGSTGATVYTPLGKPYFLPTTFLFSSNATASTLLTTGTSGASSNTTGDATNPLPPPFGVKPYIFFRYRPSGITDLSAGAPTLTIYCAAAKIVDATHGLPSNIITLQVDSVNGTARAYQP